MSLDRLIFKGSKTCPLVTQRPGDWVKRPSEASFRSPVCPLPTYTQPPVSHVPTASLGFIFHVQFVVAEICRSGGSICLHSLLPVYQAHVRDWSTGAVEPRVTLQSSFVHILSFLSLSSNTFNLRIIQFYSLLMLGHLTGNGTSPRVSWGGLGVARL